MESTRPIRALARGLDALTVLNVRDGATVSEVAQEIRLPRTTVYRILETLCGSGFVSRDNADDRYRLTIRVRTLSTGVDDEEWIDRVAKPCLAQLGKDIVWPVSIATLSGTRMIIRESTDHGTPLAIDRYSTGFRLDLAASSAGRVFLAFCDAADRDRLIQALSLNSTVKAELVQALEETRSQSYCSTSRTRRQLAETSLSVPVRLSASAATPSPAVLTLRYLASALPAQSAQERFLPKLRECAAKIADQVSEQQAAGRHQRPPQAAS